VNLSTAQNIEDSESSEIRTAALLILLGAALRVVSFFLSKNTGGDAGARVALTAIWVRNPSWKVIFDSYPPGHFWLIGGLSILTHNVLFAGRFLSLLLGIGSLFLVWRLARLLFGGSAALLSLLVFDLYSIQIAYSTTSSSEISYLFFLLLSIWLLFSYLQEGTGGLSRLVLSGLSMSISESIRFEAWIFFFGLSVILAISLCRSFDRERSFRASLLSPLLAFGIMGGIWPVFMMWYCYRNFGDPMYLVTWTHLRVQQLLAAQPSPLSYQVSLMPVVLLITLCPLALAAAIYGWTKSFTLQLPRALAALTLFFFAVQNYQLLKGATVAVARYTLTMGTLLAVFSGYGLHLLCKKLAPRRMTLAVLLVAAFLTANTLAVLALSEVPNRYADKFASVSPRLRYPTRIAEVGKFLRLHMAPADAIVIDDYNEESNILADAAGLPLIPDGQSYLQSRGNDTSARQYIDLKHPRFIVYSDLGTLRASLTLPKNCEQEVLVERMTFRCVFENRIYRVYELSF
jgi:4-amino-4-deoxy-L-arabinose transferase-like glycosyltransferase